MFRPLISAISLFVVLGPVGTAAAATGADTAPKSSWHQVAPNENTTASYDAWAERELLSLANSDRARAGLTQLKVDEGLVRAARAHAAEMASQNQLSHQFSGEPPLARRIAAVSLLHLDRAGENVAVASNIADAHQGLMASPPHRDNLLSPQFNVAGIGVFRSGHLLYITQDFGASTPSYSVKQAQEFGFCQRGTTPHRSSFTQAGTRRKPPRAVNRLQHGTSRFAHGGNASCGSLHVALHQHETRDATFRHLQSDRTA